MARSRWIWSALFLTLGVPSLQAVAPPPLLHPDQVTQLIAQLGDRDFLLRDRAQRQLLAHGPATLGLLPAHLTHRNPEVRRRLLRIISQLEVQRDLTPRRVHATFHNATLQDVFTRIEWQTGLITQWGDEATEPPRFTGTFHNLTYWEAIDQLAVALKARPFLQGQPIDPEGQRIRLVTLLVPSPKPARHVHRSGAFRVSALRIEHPRAVELDEDEPQNPPLHLQLQVCAESRLNLVGLGRPHLDKALDEAGRSLLPAELPAELAEGGRPEWFIGDINPVGSSETSLLLSSPARDARRIALVRGVIPAQIITGHQTRQLLASIRKGSQLTVQERVQEISAIWQSEKTNRIQLQIREKRQPIKLDDDSPQIDIYTLWTLLQFEDDDGNRCRTELTSSLFAGILLQVHPAERSGKKATRVLIREPRITTVEIPFEFRNLPLP